MESTMFALQRSPAGSLFTVALSYERLTDSLAPLFAHLCNGSSSSNSSPWLVLRVQFGCCGNHSEKQLRTSCKCQVSVALVSWSERQFVEPLFREAHLICAWLLVSGSDVIWECVVCGFLPDYWCWGHPLFEDRWTQMAATRRCICQFCVMSHHLAS